MRIACKLLAPLLLGLAAHAASAAAPVSEEARDRAEREGRARVIVRLAAPPAAGTASPSVKRARRAAIARAAGAALERVGGTRRPGLRRYGVLPLLALEASPRELAELAASPDVLSIETDRLLEPSLAESIPRVGADVSVSALWDGTGSTVVILDTGVDSAHAFLGGRVVAEACFSAGSDCPNGQITQFGPGAGVPCTYGSLCYHGTHVAGIAAGESPTLHGVAPGASLIAIQVGSELFGPACGGAGSPCVLIYDSDVFSALDYVVDTLSDAHTIAAVNMSFGSDTTWSSEASCDAANLAYKQAFDVLRSLGIASVVAAGNGGQTNGISAPSCTSSAVAVAATIDTGEQVWVSSNSGPPLDLYAPGASILSSLPGGGFASRNGTSMATPHVSGAFAALRQADSGASVATLIDALTSTGLPITRAGLVRPRLQVDDAVRTRAPAACFDGLDNDGDGLVDVDGDGGAPDPDCASGYDVTEQVVASPGGCGIGPELALALPLLSALRGRNRRRA